MVHPYGLINCFRAKHKNFMVSSCLWKSNIFFKSDVTYKRWSAIKIESADVVCNVLGSISQKTNKKTKCLTHLQFSSTRTSMHICRYLLRYSFSSFSPPHFGVTQMSLGIYLQNLYIYSIDILKKIASPSCTEALEEEKK